MRTASCPAVSVYERHGAVAWGGLWSSQRGFPHQSRDVHLRARSARAEGAASVAGWGCPAHTHVLYAFTSARRKLCSSCVNRWTRRRRSLSAASAFMRSSAPPPVPARPPPHPRHTDTLSLTNTDPEGMRSKRAKQREASCDSGRSATLRAEVRSIHNW